MSGKPRSTKKEIREAFKRSVTEMRRASLDITVLTVVRRAQRYVHGTDETLKKRFSELGPADLEYIGFNVANPKDSETRSAPVSDRPLERPWSNFRPRSF